MSEDQPHSPASGFQLDLHANAQTAINAKAEDVLAKTISGRSSPRASEPPPWGERFASAHITDADIIGDITTTEIDGFGTRRAVSFTAGPEQYRLAGEDYLALESLLDQLFKLAQIQRVASEKYLFNIAVAWCKERLSGVAAPPFSDYLASSLKRDVRAHEIWVPVASLETQREFQLGNCRIITLTREFFESQEGMQLAKRPEHSDTIKNKFAARRTKLQGIAAVALKVEGEKERAKTAALEIADTVISLLRLYSLAAYTPWSVCTCAAFGSEYVPKTTTIAIGKDGKQMVGFSERVDPRYFDIWRISSAHLDHMLSGNLAALGDLIYSEGLSAFSRTVRMVLLTYSTGLTFSDVSNRLVYTFSALESLLLKDTSEPIQQNLGERMAFIISRDGAERRNIVANVKEVYHSRSQFVHHRRISIPEKEVLEAFIKNARVVLHLALGEHKKFASKADFIALIDKIKFGG